MSIELNVADWDAEEYDACCTTTVAELKINGINGIDIKVNDNGMYEIEAEDSFLDINSVKVWRTTDAEGTLIEGDNFTIDIIEEV